MERLKKYRTKVGERNGGIVKMSVYEKEETKIE